MMLSAITAVLSFGGCTVGRWYLERSSCREGTYFGGLVQKTAFWNEGAAFGLPVPRETLTLAQAAAMGASWPFRKISPVGAGLILGGGLSNLYERVSRGRVFDCIRFPKAPGVLKRYVFNPADFCILAGAVCVLVSSGKRGKTGRRRV